MIHLRTNTHTEIWKADCKNLVWGDKGEVGLPDLTVVLYGPVTAAFISYLIQVELQQQKPTHLTLSDQVRLSAWPETWRQVTWTPHNSSDVLGIITGCWTGLGEELEVDLSGWN